MTLGATKAEGGSRSRTITIGGATTPAYADVLIPPVHPPAISLDVFDMKVALPKVLREHVAEVMEDPAEWARMNVKKFGADIITIHLMSTDPLFRDASPRRCSKDGRGDPAGCGRPAHHWGLRRPEEGCAWYLLKLPRWLTVNGSS